MKKSILRNIISSACVIALLFTHISHSAITGAANTDTPDGTLHALGFASPVPTVADWTTDGWTVYSIPFIGSTNPISNLYAMGLFPGITSSTANNGWGVISTNGLNQFIDFTFTGTGFRWMPAQEFPLHLNGSADIQLRAGNGEFVTIDTISIAATTLNPPSTIFINQPSQSTSVKYWVSDGHSGGITNSEAQFRLFYEITGLPYGTYTVRIQQTNNSDAEVRTNGFAFTAHEHTDILIFSGPSEFMLTVGYADTNTGAYRILGANGSNVTVEIDSDDANTIPYLSYFEWDDSLNSVRILSGLSVGEYRLKLIATDEEGGVAELSLTVIIVDFDPDFEFFLNLNTRHQIIDGFGTFLSPQSPGLVDSRNDLFSMSETVQDSILDLLFDPIIGAGMNIIRFEATNGHFYIPEWSRGLEIIVAREVDPSNSNTLFPTYDFAANPVGGPAPDVFSGFPTSPDQPFVWNTTRWNEEIGDYEPHNPLFFYTDLLSRIQERGVTNFYLNSWSAPLFMKQDMRWCTSYRLFDGGRLRSGWERMYAQYLVKHITLYRELAGIEITHIAPFNEPDLEPGYQAMLATPAEFANMMIILLEELDAQGYYDVKIVGPETMYLGRDYADTLVSSPQFAPFAGRFINSGHLYWVGQPVPRFDEISAFRTWMGEYAPITTSPWNGGYTGNYGGEHTARAVMFSMNVGLSAYIDWAAVNDNGLWNQHLFAIQAAGAFRRPGAPAGWENLGQDEEAYAVSKRLWAIANFSRYIEEGAHRVELTANTPISVTNRFANTPSNLLASAFQNPDGDYVVVVMNTGNEERSIFMHGIEDIDGKSPIVDAFITNDNNALTQMNNLVQLQPTNGTVGLVVPPRSTVTYTFRTAISPIESARIADIDEYNGYIRVTLDDVYPMNGSGGYVFFAMFNDSRFVGASAMQRLGVDTQDGVYLFPIPQNADRIKVMVWNNFAPMSPLGDFAEAKRTGENGAWEMVR